MPFRPPLGRRPHGKAPSGTKGGRTFEGPDQAEMPLIRAKSSSAPYGRRYGIHRGSRCPVPMIRHARPVGGAGWWRIRHPSSDTCRSALTWLQWRHAATTLSHECLPPRLRGTTWSTLVATPPQYTHRPPSRANSARRVSGTGPRKGTRTKRVSWTTLGAGMAHVALCISTPESSRHTALLFRTRMSARRSGTTPSGSYDAFRTRTCGTGASLSTGGTWLAPPRSPPVCRYYWPERHHDQGTDQECFRSRWSRNCANPAAWPVHPTGRLL